jgi:hypothetical protein
VQGFKNGATLQQLQASVVGFGSPAFYTMGSKLLNPKFLEWNLELQQQVGTNYTFSLNYVGNHGMDIMTINPFANAYCNSCPFGGLSSSAPDPRFAQIADLTNKGYSNYHGLTAGFRGRISKSFTGGVNYTWSHDLDTCSNNCLEQFISTTSYVSQRYQVTPNLPGLAYSNSDYDVRHNVNVNYVYTAKDNWSNRGMNEVLGGWTFAGTVFFHSGFPWTPVSTSVRNELANVTGLRNGTPLAQFAGTPQEFGNCSSPDTKCVTAAQFVPASAQTGFGNYPRNTLRAAGFFDTDFNVTKNFKLGERLGLAVGANFFNLFNHPNFNLPNNNAGSGLLGSITETVSPATNPYGAFLAVPLTGRIVQLNGRITF